MTQAKTRPANNSQPRLGASPATSASARAPHGSAPSADRPLDEVESVARIGSYSTDITGTIEYVNPAFERVSGYRRDEAVGQNPRILQSSHQPAAFYRALWRRLTRGQSWSGTLINRRKDGSLYADPGPRPALLAGPSPHPDRRDRDRQHLAQPPLGDTREFQLQNPG